MPRFSFLSSCCKCRLGKDVIDGSKMPGASSAEPTAGKRSVRLDVPSREDQDEAPSKQPLRLQRKSSAASSLYYFDAVEFEEREDDNLECFFDAAEDENLQCFEASYITTDDSHRYGLSSEELLLAPAYRSTTRKHHQWVSHKSKEWGFPGNLTRHQLKAYLEFKTLLHQRGGVYKEMVYCYRDIEQEPYALCRYLRFCNFNVPRVFKYMDEHVEKWEIAKANDFYPTIWEAVGAPVNVLLTQFPSVYSGYSRDGYPVCYFNSGSVNVEGIECICDTATLPNFIWYTMMHDVKDIFAKVQAIHPEFNRLEQITVMNMDGISPSVFTPRVYAVTREVDQVSMVWPEMLNKLIIINAPSFFSLVWSIIKGLLDPNTTKRIEIYSSETKGRERLLQLIDASELPRDYGGSAMATTDKILENCRHDGEPLLRRQIVELMAFRRRRQSQMEFELADNERVSIWIFTRSASVVEFTVISIEQGTIKATVVSKKSAQSNVCANFKDISGPGRFRMETKATSDSSNSSSTEYFLVVGEVFAQNETGLNGMVHRRRLET